MNACACPDWRSNMPIIQQFSQGEAFRFCPWCGIRLASGQPNPALLTQYRERIEEAFFTKGDWGMPQDPNMLVASRPIEDYRQLTGDLLGTLDLMLTFVEMGTKFTNEYGDIDEPFYEGLELMLDDFRDLLLANPALYEEGNLAWRLTKLARSTWGVGWGYGDYVTGEINKIQHHFGDI